MNIDAVIDGVIGREGAYNDHPNDRGGPTRWGVTQATARANGYAGDMRAFPRDAAVSIYRKQYVEAPGFGAIGAISTAIAAELVDTGVNMGPIVAGRMLQRALNALNNGARDYPDLLMDGHLGATSRAALSAFLHKRGALGERRLLMLLNALQGERYVALCEGRADNEAFMYGWLDRIAS